MAHKKEAHKKEVMKKDKMADSEKIGHVEKKGMKKEMPKKK